MIEKRTVFILGAGASCPYGFPSGGGLVKEIRESFISSSMGQLSASGPWRLGMGDPLAESKRFVEVLTKSRTQSIDLFLSRNPEFALIGKTAIVATILAHERASRFREKMPSDKLQYDWYTYLLQRLTDGLINKQDYTAFTENKVSFVTFNYDRSLEHFLFESLSHSFYGVSPQQIQTALQAIPIIHVYGQVAPLDWQDSSDARTKLAYRKNEGHVDVPRLTDNLHVIHEERENPNLEEAREEISKAERIFFLGFGYAKENLEALGFPGVLEPRHHIYGTAMDRTPNEIQDLERDFVHGLQQSGNKSAGVGDRVEVHATDCVGLLRKFP